MWLYFVPTDTPPPLKEPVLVPIKRTGFTVVELGVLTDFELANSNLPGSLHKAVSTDRVVAGVHRERPENGA
jgi:hypothetical protein